LPVIWKMAALMELCPAEVQDMVYQNVDDVSEDYDKLKQKIISWTSNKISNDGVPMDIGKVEWEAQQDYDFDVAAVGWHTQCYNCGGWGHQSRECVSEKKGGGKGDKGKGKGHGQYNNFNGKGGKDSGKGGKDFGKGGKDGGKSTGKGYQGTCFVCNKVGHKAWECRSKRVNAVDEEQEEDEDGAVAAGHVEINTVWSIGAVAVEVNGMEVEKELKTKNVQITLDSGAGASCWPEKLLKGVPMKPKDKGVKFKAANGAELKYHGTKYVRFKVGAGGDIGELKFHVTDTTKPLASAAAITKMGNRVVLEDGPGRAYIENVQTGRRIPLKESGGTFVFDAECFTSPVFSGRE
jgi:hypothetical protein